MTTDEARERAAFEAAAEIKRLDDRIQSLLAIECSEVTQ